MPLPKTWAPYDRLLAVDLNAEFDWLYQRRPRGGLFGSIGDVAVPLNSSTVLGIGAAVSDPDAMLDAPNKRLIVRAAGLYLLAGVIVSTGGAGPLRMNVTAGPGAGTLYAAGGSPSRSAGTAFSLVLSWSGVLAVGDFVNVIANPVTDATTATHLDRLLVVRVAADLIG